MTLEPLSRRESRLLLGELLQHVREVPRELVDLVVDGAEGNPFYIEELVTWLVDAGVVVRGDDAWDVRVDRIEQVRVPSTLKGVLQSRLDSLDGAERAVLQRASVIGRVFWDDAVAHLGGGTSSDLPVAGALDRLRGRELVHQRGSSAFDSSREFLFKHALLRDVAYDGMLRSHRRGYHALVAGWLAEVTERHGRVEEYAAVIAEHTDLAGDPSAARWYLRAGARAARVYASEEALRLLGRGLLVAPEDDPVLRFDLLREREQVADRLAERDRQREDLELMGALLDDVDVPRRLHHDLARARLAFDSSDYDQSVRWAREAAGTAGRHGLDDQAAQGHLWAGKALTWASQGEAARDELDAALAIAQRAGLRGTEAETWRYLSMLAGNAGDYPTALELVTRAREMFAEVGDAEGEGTALVGQATVLYQQGRFTDARGALEQARPVFQRSGHRYREAVVLGNLGTIAAMQGELAAALGWVDQAVEVTRRIDDTEALGTNLAVHAEIDAILGRTDEVRRHGREALALARRVRLHSLAATALTCSGRPSSSTATPRGRCELVDEGIEATRDAPSERERAFALVVRGDVLLALGRPDEARTAYEEAEQAFDRLEVHGTALEARAKRARALLAGGDVAGAHELAAGSRRPPRRVRDGGRPGRRRRRRVLGGAGRRRRPGRPGRAGGRGAAAATPGGGRRRRRRGGRVPRAAGLAGPAGRRSGRRGRAVRRPGRGRGGRDAARAGPRAPPPRCPAPARRWCSGTPPAAGCTTRRCWPRCAAPREAGVAGALVEQPYRVAGRRLPAPAGQVDAALLAVLAHLRAGSDLPLVTGGRSFGGRVACRTSLVADVRGVLCLAFPLLPAGAAPEKTRLPELDAVQAPVLVVQGDRDPFGCPPGAPGRALVVLPADHSLRTVLPAGAGRRPRLARGAAVGRRWHGRGMTTRTYPAGVPSWIDLVQPDVDAAAAFYGGLLGWSVEQVTPPGAPRYLVARLDGQDVAGLGEGEGDGWATYVAVDDADEACGRVRAAGGSVVEEPQDAGEGGRAATCTDPQGVVFRLWQARRRAGAQLTNAPGTWNFSDLHTSDPEGAARFYGEVFGWETTDLGYATMLRRPGYGDHLASTVDPAIHERQAAISAPPGFADAIAWLVGVDAGAPRGGRSPSRSTTATPRRRGRSELGGEVLGTDDTDWTRTALVRDPQGAVLTLSEFTPPGG